MQRTMFILGAAASKEFDRTDNMPTGSELAARIEILLHDELGRGSPAQFGPIKRALMQHGGVSRDHTLAMSRILRGVHSRDSIDQFVDDCRDVPQVDTIAKLCIAHLILKAESDTILGELHRGGPPTLFRQVRDSWLGLVCRYANPTSNRQSFKSVFRDVGFITFNYDRCIEQFLLQWAMSVTDNNIEEARHMVAGVPIHHVFGSLGALAGHPWQEFTPEVEFGDVEGGNLLRAAANIKTFTEEVGSEHQEFLQNQIFGAQEIVLLGNAFHSQNMRLLFGAGPRRETRFFGTTFRMRPSAIDQVKMYFSPTKNGGHFADTESKFFVSSIQDDIFY